VYNLDPSDTCIPPNLSKLCYFARSSNDRWPLRSRIAAFSAVNIVKVPSDAIP
jgi:hypothetical protein